MDYSIKYKLVIIICMSNNSNLVDGESLNYLET